MAHLTMAMVHDWRCLPAAMFGANAWIHVGQYIYIHYYSQEHPKLCACNREERLLLFTF
jgi:hypothetical protein